MMTSKQRVLAAVNHQVSDRTPITFDAEKEVYEKLYAHLKIDSKEAMFDRLNCDTWMIIPRNFSCWESDADQDVRTNIWGYQTTVTSYAQGTYDELTFSPLADKNDVSHIKKHEWPPDDALDFSHFSSEAQAHQDRAIIGVFTHGTYTVASFVRGMENLLTDLAFSKPYVEHLFNTINERMLYFLDNMLEKHSRGIDIVYLADDYCSQRGPLFSPAIFREFVFPYLREVADRVHRHNKKFLLHVCGAVRPLLPMIIDAGVDMLEPIQVRAQGMQTQALKRDFGRDLCLYGGVDLQEVLCNSTPQDVSDEVKNLIDTLGQDGGYILGPGHTYIQVDAPIPNILAMYETADQYRPWSV